MHNECHMTSSFKNSDNQVDLVATTFSGSQTTLVFSCRWHTNADIVTSKLQPSWNQFRFHSKGRFHFHFFLLFRWCALLLLERRQERVDKHIVLRLYSCTRFSLPLFGIQGTPKQVLTGNCGWSHSASNRVRLEKQPWLWAHYCVSSSPYNILSPEINMFCNYISETLLQTIFNQLKRFALTAVLQFDILLGIPHILVCTGCWLRQFAFTALQTTTLGRGTPG